MKAGGSSVGRDSCCGTEGLMLVPSLKLKLRDHLVLDMPVARYTYP